MRSDFWLQVTGEGSFWCLGCRASLDRAFQNASLSQDKPQGLCGAVLSPVLLLCPAGPQLNRPRELSRVFCLSLAGSWGLATLLSLWAEQAQYHPLLWSLLSSGEQRKLGVARGSRGLPFFDKRESFLVTKLLDKGPKQLSLEEQQELCRL